MHTKFVGLEPWPQGIEIVQCHFQGRTYDLHNEFTLREVAFTCNSLPDLRFRFTDDGSQQRCDLVFTAVRNLRFEEDDRSYGEGLWDPTQVETFIGAEYLVGDEMEFDVETILGRYSFSCNTVRFEQLTS
jgi:hypothetical protein